MSQPSSAGAAAAESSASQEPAILALPVELQKTVIEYLTSYRDMKSTGLVCKQLNAIVTPYLYRNMQVSAEVLDNVSFTETITKTHLGLRSVRTVRIVHPYPRSARIGRAACLLLSTIPRDSLTRFELLVPTSPRVAREIFDCVHQKQRKVDNHQYDGFCLRDRYGNEEVFAAGINHLARLKHLRLCLWEVSCCSQAKFVLDSMHELTSLDVDLGRACYTHRPILLHLIFRAFSVEVQRLCIRSLRWHGVDFDQYGDIFPRLPGVQTLKHLQLADCINYRPLLRMLTALSLDLTTLVIKEQYGDNGRFESDANDFIQSLRSPEKVSLTLDSHFGDSQFLFLWSTLHKCAPAIKSLKVQYTSMLPPYLSDDSVSEFRRFCKNASSLEQLSMSGIEVFISNTSGDKYTPGRLEQFLDCIRTASALVVLKLTVWVNCHAIPRTYDASTKALTKEAQDMAHRREHLVKRTADKILSTLASDCPRLNVVVIETAWRYDQDDHSVRAFLKSRQIDLFGHTTVVGMPIEPHMVKHYEPCSDILEPDRFVFA